ncbi:MAG TPA: hypothetical protein PKD90_04465 [Phnomibacter sp.]|nr:hypothetical protein [Phnomibacter sp.]
MPLNATRLTNAIKQAYTNAQAVSTNADDALNLFASQLAQAIIDEVKQLQVVYSTGLTNGGGPVVGTLNHTIE